MNSETRGNELRGQVALVTGGGRGIGRAIAVALAQAGAAVAVMARSTNELAETLALVERAGGRGCSLPADVTDAEAVRSVVREAELAMGGIDLLVNNAGVPGPIGPFWENDPEEWWRAMDVNLRGAMLCARNVLPGMVARRRGRIINVASGAAGFAIAYFSAYVASKTALARFTECLATETKPYGISAFVIGPGTVRTAMAEYSLNSEEGKKWLPWFPKIFEQGLASPPERPAQLVVRLASGKADALSGRFLTTADDLEMILEKAEQVEKENLYALRVGRLTAPNPVYALIQAEAEKR